MVLLQHCYPRMVFAQLVIGCCKEGACCHQSVLDKERTILTLHWEKKRETGSCLEINLLQFKTRERETVCGSTQIHFPPFFPFGSPPSDTFRFWQFFLRLLQAVEGFWIFWSSLFEGQAVCSVGCVRKQTQETLTCEDFIASARPHFPIKRDKSMCQKTYQVLRHENDDESSEQLSLHVQIQTIAQQLSVYHSIYS